VKNDGAHQQRRDIYAGHQVYSRRSRPARVLRPVYATTPMASQKVSDSRWRDFSSEILGGDRRCKVTETVSTPVDAAEEQHRAVKTRGGGVFQVNVEYRRRGSTKKRSARKGLWPSPVVSWRTLHAKMRSRLYKDVISYIKGNEVQFRIFLQQNKRRTRSPITTSPKRGCLRGQKREKKEGFLHLGRGGQDDQRYGCSSLVKVASRGKKKPPTTPPTSPPPPPQEATFQVRIGHD